MGVAKPVSEYAAQMLTPDAWPEVDEDNYYDRAQQYTEVLRQVTAVLETCQHEQSDIFDGGFWSGGAAAAAKSELGTNIDELKKLQNGLATVITWQRYVADSVTQAKWDVSDIVEAAQTEIRALENDSTLDAAERTTAINSVLSTAYGANLSVVTGTAERIVASKAWKPPHNALRDLLDQKTPPPVTLPDGPSSPAPPVEEDGPRPGPAPPAPVTPPPAAPPLAPPAMPPSAMPTPGPGAQPPPGMPTVPGQVPAPPAVKPGGGGPAVPGGPGGPGGVPAPPSAPAAPLSPAASAEPLGAGGRGKGMTPASLMSPSVAPRTEESATAAPVGGAGMPAGLPGASGGGSRGGGAGAGAGASAAQKPPTGSASTRPAAAGNRPAPARPAASAGDPASTERSDAADAVVVTPIIPVSKARAERDAIADAATADAARRQADPLRLARRIAAALNAPGANGAGELGFFWVTAVTTDGQIVVANSYGLAYIPDGVQLPEQVQMASADDAIPAAERARWATYPVMAVQGWAQHHDQKLRAVIATEEQLANSDPGAAKVLLKPDDIPDNGDMVGLSRLAVVDPEAADRLAATTDVRLVNLLPPAPADATPSADSQRAPDELMDSDAAAHLAASLAEGKISLQEMLAQVPKSAEDPAPPVDQRPMLWFDVMKPLASRSPGRQAAHLRAFHRYAEHAQEVLVAQAHTAADPVAQRAAVADWLYWKHLTGLLSAALSDAS
ncbi:hypothetical protein A9X03_26335 [Mycobacterium sp. E1715]|uniref:hypothetical protein n=1 Tax=unclassified Mycobacterium TaxID=2642494 RepID=UPI0007FC9719|nr:MULTISPECIES: hypothetical protein [unclassified Mycobacterium]OBG62060.1 hypothetical protein A5703_22065 [Mycobacterium sp. E188]OBG81703.1 hypothetical protein A5701_10160 [Mycobacterium sp. E3305]OBH11876.1 hypothetical protein A9X03_26335 [Mycobacterium sp. E1715]OBH39594.1 hypothetical protein A5691_21675 [Mycobacterium sp. E183]